MPSYDFKNLSSFDFEELTRDLLQKEWGVRLESFKPGRDKGIDLRHISVGGKVIIQCKHYAGSTLHDLISTLKNKELNKVRALSPDRYIIATSLALSPGDKDKIVAAMTPHIISTLDVIGRDDLNNLLGRHQEIETAHFKLWLSSTTVIERVLNNATVIQSDFQVDKILKKLPLYVENDSFNRARDILDRHNFLVVSGPPGIGKTTLAEMLLYTYLWQEYAPIQVRSHPQEAFHIYNKTKKQIFYYDDFLGQTFLNDKMEKNEDAALADLIELVSNSKNAKLILTTREYILNQALSMYDRIGNSNLLAAKYVLNIGAYTKPIRAKILYNHLYFSDIGPERVRSVARGGGYNRIIDHENYNPRIIEWMTQSARVNLVSPQDYLEFFVGNLDNPDKLWAHAYKNITASAQHLLQALLSLGGEVSVDRLRAVFSAYHSAECLARGISRGVDDFMDGLKELDGTFTSSERGKIVFQNPSVKDFLEGKFKNEPALAEGVLKTASQFDQIRNALALMHADGADDVAVRAKSAVIVNALMVTLGTPSYFETKKDNYTTKVAADTPLSQRLSTILDLGKSIGWSDVAPMAVTVAQQMKSEAFWGEDSAARWASLMPEIADSSMPTESKLQILNVISEAVVEEAVGCSDFSTFEALAEAFARGMLTDNQAREVQSAFEAYMDDHLYDDCGDCGSSDEMEKFRDDFKRTCRIYGFDPYWKVDSLNEMIQEREKEERYNDDSEGSWNGGRSTPSTDAESIDIMFQTLLND